MKNQLKRIMQVEGLALLIIVGYMITMKAMGAETVAVEEVPVWLKAVLDFITSIPGVGPILLSILKWIGVVAAVLTGVATTVMAIANALKIAGQALGFQSFADKVDGIYKKIWPWIAWLSVYNVQKP